MGTLKRVVRKLLRREKINRRVRTALRPLQFVLGRERFARLFPKLPVLGLVEVAVPEGRPVRICAGEGDEIATLLYFGGYGGYEHESLELFRRLSMKAEAILDIGANIGLYSLVAASVNPRARIFAFEPVKRVYRLFQRNLAKSGFDNVTPVLGAMMDCDGEVDLYVPRGTTPTYARTKRLSKGRKGRRIKVPAFAGDSFVRENKIARIDLIKIDTERTEPVVLAGFRETLRRDKPDILCEVLFGHGAGEALMDLLGPVGYKAFHVTDAGLTEQNPVEGDATYTFRNFLFTARGADVSLRR